jgi:hypothetical protein
MFIAGLRKSAESSQAHDLPQESLRLKRFPQMADGYVHE